MTRGTLAGALVVGLALGSCGQPSAVDLRGRPVRLSVSEYHVTPQRIVVNAGQLSIEIHNAGILAHEIAIGRGVLIYGRTSWIKPGQTATLTITAVPGLYRIFDPTATNDAAGLSGSIQAR
jgi:cupredoxin-like protein